MKPTFGRILLALIIFALGAGQAVNAQMGTTAFTGTLTGTAICAEPPQNYEESISEVGQVDYWEIWLPADQKLVIEVEAEDIGSLDAYLEVFDENENIIGANNDQVDMITGYVTSLDPYLEIIAPSDGYYYIAISSASDDPYDYRAQGPYKFLVQCPDHSSSPEFKWPLQAGELLGATGSNPGSFIKITPETAESTLPFPMGIGPITDIEFDPSSNSLFVAVEAVVGDENIPARIVAIDPTLGTEVESFSLGTEVIVALEAAEDKLYGVRVDSSGANFYLAEVTFSTDTESKTAKLADVFSFQWDVSALAYNSVDKVMYGVAAVEGTSSLFTIDLESYDIKILGPTGFGQFMALDFSDNNVLFGIDRSGNLLKIDHITGQAVSIGDPIIGITSLTFVVEEAPQNEDPTIKIICSSSFTNQTAASSESTNKLSRFKLGRNPQNSAVGLFKFKGEMGEIVNLSICLEEKEAVESEEASASSWVEKLLPNWQPKKRVFVFIRDAIPDVEFRAKQKGELTQAEPTLDIGNINLPATGLYYIMVIRPFRRFNNFDYCLSLNSMNGTAGESLVVAWPKDESEQNAPATLADVNTADEPVGVAITGSSASEPVADEGSSVGDDQQQTDETITGESSGNTAETLGNESLMNPADEGSSLGDGENTTGNDESAGDTTSDAVEEDSTEGSTS